MVNDWIVLASVVIMAIMVVTQLFVNAKAKQKMDQYIIEFHTLEHMYDLLVTRVKEVTELNGEILDHAHEVLANDQEILNDAKKVLAETEELRDRVKEGVRERSMYKTLGSDLESGE